MPSELASDPENKVMFLSFYPRKEDVSSGVIHARLNLKRDRERLSQSRDAFIAEWEKMFSLGKQELQTFLHIRDAGFVPDMIFISFFDGPALFLRHSLFFISADSGARPPMPGGSRPSWTCKGAWLRRAICILSAPKPKKHLFRLRSIPSSTYGLPM